MSQRQHTFGRRKRTTTTRRRCFESLENRMLMTAVPHFDWSMADRFGIDRDGDQLIDLHNLPGFVQSEVFEVTLDGSQTEVADGWSAESFEWSVTSPGLDQFLSGSNGAAVRESLDDLDGDQVNTLLPQGIHYATLKVTTENQATGEVTTSEISEPFLVRDILIASIGDSMSSGEGNPEIERGGEVFPVWGDTDFGPIPARDAHYDGRIAHRSHHSFAAQAALELERRDKHTSVTFVSVASSGATIEEGLVNPQLEFAAKDTYDGPALSHDALGDNAPDSQIDQLESIVGSRTIDALTISIGINDLGFGNIANNLTQLPERPAEAVSLIDGEPAPQTTAEVIAQVNTLADGLNGPDGEYGKLNERLEQLDVAKTFITEYPDPTRGDDGEVAELLFDIVDGPLEVAVGDLKADVEEVAVAQQIVGRLNAEVETASVAHGWTYVPDVAAAFETHGYGAEDRFIVRAREAAASQGPGATAVERGLIVSAGAAAGAGASVFVPWLVGPIVVGSALIANEYVDTTERAGSTGTLHPNRQGHEQLAEKLLIAVGDPTGFRDTFVAATEQRVNGIGVPVEDITFIDPHHRGEGHELTLRQSVVRQDLLEFLVDGQLQAVLPIEELDVLDISAGRGTLLVEDVPAHVELRVDGSMRTEIGKSSRLETIQGAIEVTNSPGPLVISDQANSEPRQVTVTRSQIAGLGPNTIAYDPLITELSIFAGSGGNRFDIPHVPHSTLVEVHTGDGRDRVTLGVAEYDRQHLQLLREEGISKTEATNARIRIYGQNGLDTVDVDALVQERLNPLTPGTIETPVGGGFDLVVGEPGAGPIDGEIGGPSESPGEVQGVDETGLGFSIVAVPVEIYGGARVDRIYVGRRSGHLDHVKSQVYVESQTNFFNRDTVELFDRENANDREEYRVGSETLDRDYFGGLEFSEYANVTLHSATGSSSSDSRGATFHVARSPAGSVVLNGSPKNDQFIVGRNNRLSGIDGNVLLIGAGGSDSVFLNDSGNSSTQTYTVNRSTVSGNGFGNVSYRTVEDLALNTGNGRNTIYVDSTASGVETTVRGGTGNETFHLARDTGLIWRPGGQLSALAGELTIDGGSGYDTATFQDGNNRVATTYTVGIGRLTHQRQRDAARDILFQRFDALNLNAGEGNDKLDLIRSNRIQYSLNGGDGNDNFKVPTRSLSRFSRPVRFDGGSGDDTLDYSAFGTSVVANLRLRRATNLSSIADFENVNGGRGNDLIVGDAAANQLRGNGGNDVIIGGAGVDLVMGGSGNDLLVGSATRFDTNTRSLDRLRSVWAKTATDYRNALSQLARSASFTRTQLIDDRVADRIYGNSGIDTFVGHRSTRTGADRFMDLRSYEPRSV